MGIDYPHGNPWWDAEEHEDKTGTSSVEPTEDEEAARTRKEIWADEPRRRTN